MELDKILILGGGRTGIALDNLLNATRTSHAWIADTRLIDNPAEYLKEFSEIITSPGISSTNNILQACQCLGIPIRSELDYAASKLDCPILAITGTNGKTTVAKLVADMVRASGQESYCAGNVGVPLSSIVGQPIKRATVVAEVSSYMLEYCPTFHPRSACITNITPDHLERHSGMEGYIAAKKNIFAHMNASDTVVLNGDDEITSKISTPSQPVYFSVHKSCAAYLEGDNLMLDGVKWLSRAELKLKGIHNVANVLASALIAYAAGVSPHAAARAARMFVGVAHRIEYVGQDERGVAYYNDSKATNIASTLTALAAFKEPLVLIVGGSAKGYDFESLISSIPSNCRSIIATGATAPMISAAANRVFEKRLVVVDGFDNAVRAASSLAMKGDSVLLSPACASFDAFQDYKERGETFIKLAKELGAHQ